MKKRINKPLFNSAKSGKTASKQETKQILKRLTNPKKILQQESQQTNGGASHSGSASGSASSPEEVNLQSERMELPVVSDSPAISTSMETKHMLPTEVVTEHKEVEQNTAINLADSGFLEPVIEREYAEKHQTQLSGKQEQEVQELERSIPLIEEQGNVLSLSEGPVIEKPKILFAPKITLQTDNTYKKIVGEEIPNDNKIGIQEITGARIPIMQYQEASIDLGDDAQPLGRQIGETAGNTTSEWAFGMLENFYPEVVAFFTNIPTSWIEKAKLPNELEVELVSKVLAANTKNKNRVKISDFHKKNILPPLQRILSKKGWENVMPDELQLVIGLVVLAADSFFKMQEIKKENRLLEKQLKHKVQQYIDIRTEERKEIDSLKGEVSTMKDLIAQFTKVQQAAA